MKSYLALLAVILCGCNTTKFTQTSVVNGVTNNVEIVNSRVFWKSGSYKITPGQPGAMPSIECNASAADSQSMGQLIGTALKYAK